MSDLIKSSLSFTVTEVNSEWVFYNEVLFVAVYGYNSAGTYQGRLVKVAMSSPTNTSYMATPTISSFITLSETKFKNLAAYELTGIFYTKESTMGYFLAKIDYSTMTSVSSTVTYGSTVYWNIY